MERADADVTLDAFDVLPTTRALATRACWSGSPTAARHVGEAGGDRGGLRVCALSLSPSLRGGFLQGIGLTLKTPPNPSRQVWAPRRRARERRGGGGGPGGPRRKG